MRKRWGRPLSGLAITLALLLGGCGTDAGGSTNANAGGIVLNVGKPTVIVTPTFPPYTVGAWVSNPSPSQHDNITIYAVVRQQPTDLSSPPAAPKSGTQVKFSIVNIKDQTVTVDGSGIAAFQTTAEGNPTQPQLINVTAIVGNQTVAQAITFYTILPTQYPFPTLPPTTPSPTK